MRYPNNDFQYLDLRVHEILKTPRLVDVWAVPLENGGTDRALADVLALIEGAAYDVNPVVRGLFRLRQWIGTLLRWDAATPDHPPIASYVHSLPNDLVAASLDTVGMFRGPVRILYRLENELLAEVMNATVHAFISFSLFARDDGYVAYLAVYVIHTKWWTRYYLAAIEPFRRFLVYPSLVKTLQKRWRATYATPSDGRP